MNSTLRRVPRMVGIPAMMAVKFGAPEILHVVEAPAHRVETKTGGSAGGRCRSGSGLRVVLALLAEESPLPEFGQFGNAAAKDEMRLGSGAVHGFLLFFGSFVHDGSKSRSSTMPKASSTRRHRRSRPVGPMISVAKVCSSLGAFPQWTARMRRYLKRNSAYRTQNCI